MSAANDDGPMDRMATSAIAHARAGYERALEVAKSSWANTFRELAAQAANYRATVLTQFGQGAVHQNLLRRLDHDLAECAALAQARLRIWELLCGNVDPAAASAEEISAACDLLRRIEEAVGVPLGQASKEAVDQAVRALTKSLGDS